MDDETPLQGGPGKQELPRPPSFSSALLAAFLSIAFGANAVAIKMSLAGIGPFTAAGLRFLIASTTIFIWARASGRSIRVRRNQVFTLFVLWLLFFSQISLLYLGIHLTNASRATLITNLQPFFVLFLAHLLIRDERITLRKTIGLLLAFAGVCLVFLEREGVNDQFRTGDLLIVLTTLLWAASSVYTKRVIHVFSPYLVVLYPMVFSVPLFFVGRDDGRRCKPASSRRPPLSGSGGSLFRFHCVEHPAPEAQRGGAQFFQFPHADRGCVSWVVAPL
jgi:drug/metabolite transporter (DMT)-like permease